MIFSSMYFEYLIKGRNVDKSVFFGIKRDGVLMLAVLIFEFKDFV